MVIRGAAGRGAHFLKVVIHLAEQVGRVDIAFARPNRRGARRVGNADQAPARSHVPDNHCLGLDLWPVERHSLVQVKKIGPVLQEQLV